MLDLEDFAGDKLDAEPVQARGQVCSDGGTTSTLPKKRNRESNAISWNLWVQFCRSILVSTH